LLEREVRMAAAKQPGRWKQPEDISWQHLAGEPTAADSAGPYTHEQWLRMDADFVAAVERAFAVGLESPQAAAATYAIASRAA